MALLCNSIKITFSKKGNHFGNQKVSICCY
nr:MAG TPA_asm: hypothetical protein [Caudoviricetes sp.]